MSDRIYHYTSVQSLACILKYKTMRFTRLDCLNDPNEGIALNFKNSAKQIYCSSWTKRHDDFIPMWRMYSDLDGIRLSLPEEIFKVRGQTQAPESMKPVRYNYLSNEVQVTEVNSKDSKTSEVGLGQLCGPDPVLYQKDEFEISPVFSFGDADIQEDQHSFAAIGLFKGAHWEFEEEVRFRLMRNLAITTTKSYGEVFRNNISYEQRFVDVPLCEGVFEHAEVMLGPLCKNSPNEILVDALLKNYAPNAKVSKSQIDIQKI
ncbi:Protein of unknown function [Pseudovibrio denitrificans]|uniref:DUF2971 domain-containing protein n=1 Tax=Pseudovibrio denitrificans TaxID=258256 RepID=A0A1I6Y052_9HYPH|nr:DUF2971 domain-containing protein [Pseudovibrio denitrificans]SFT43743.1 Protein of unknown function [Pseudovibrio denitrificans]